MNLNRLYSIFQSSRLERKDVETYGRSTDPLVRNEIEQKEMSDSFDADAMEGWEQLSYNPAVMSRLDQKFAPSTSPGLYKIIGGTALVGSAVIAILYFTVFKESPKPLVAHNSIQKEEITSEKEPVIVLEASDVALPAPIERMKHAPKAEQVPAKQISKEFQEIIQFREETPNLPVKPLPNVDPENSASPEIVRNHKEAKEIYLHSMKLVDYRKYRDKPQVKTKQLILTGTPANKEDEYSEEEDPVWKDVDVPYIEYIEKSVGIFEHGNYKKALSRFQTIMETYPDDVNANFYGGICLFNLGEYSKAIPHFENCLSGAFSNFDEEAQWMIAECYEKSGDSAKARVIYRSIASGNGFYANQAKDKLK